MHRRLSTKNQITIKGFNEELRDSIQRLARSEGISLNQAALRLLRRGASLSDLGESSNTVSDSLDHLIGKWTHEEADNLDAALMDFETIDEGV